MKIFYYGLPHGSVKLPKPGRRIEKKGKRLLRLTFKSEGAEYALRLTATSC